MRFRPTPPVNASASRCDIAALALSLLLLAGCRKPGVVEPATPPVIESKDEQSLAPPPPEPGTIESPPIVVPPPPSPIPGQTPLPPESVAELNARFHAKATTPGERDEIIQALGRHESPQALPTLSRIFDEEKRLELRMRVLEVAGEPSVDPAAPGRWELFARATEARQPMLIRLSAMQTLADLEDPRVPALLKQLARDTNAAIRENAVRILHERQN